MASSMSTKKKQACKSTLMQSYYKSKIEIQNFASSGTSSTSMDFIIKIVDHSYSCAIRYMEDLYQRHRNSYFQRYSTTTNVGLRKSELQQKLVAIKNKNNFILKEIFQLEQPCQHIEKSKVSTLQSTVKRKVIPLKMFSGTYSNVADDELLDVGRLKQISNELEKEITAYNMNFASKKDYQDLLKKYNEKQILKEDLQQKYKSLVQSYCLFKENMKKLQVELKYINLHVELTKSLCDLMHGLNSYNPLELYIEEGLIDSDEPEDVNKLNHVMNFMKKFDKHFASGDYESAAKLAATSPDGILRNYSTFHQFQNVTTSCTSKISPAMAFCKAIMVPPSRFKKLSSKLSFEMMKCAIHADDLLLIKQWICGGVITLSMPLGDFLFARCTCNSQCNCNYTLFALHVYSKMKAHDKALECHLKLGNISHVVSALLNDQNSNVDVIKLFSKHPSVQLLYNLPRMEKTFISFPTVIGVYLQQCMFSDMITFLDHVYTNGYHGCNLMKCLLDETYADQMNEDKWIEVVRLCDMYSRNELAEELYACLLARVSLENATNFCLIDYRS